MTSVLSQDLLPFQMPPADVFFTAQRKVWAHYFYPFPLMIGDPAPPNDYYNNGYLALNGESGVHAAYGGYLRARPLPVPIVADNITAITNMKREVAMALSRGITGFCFDILSLADALSPTGHLQTLMAAAAAVDPRFAVVPMLDMNALGAITPVQIVSLMAAIHNNPSIMAISDGRTSLAAYDAPLQNAAWWQSVIAALNAANINVAFVPIFLGAPGDAGTLNAISTMVGGWGTATPGPSASIQANVALAAKAGLLYALPIMTQQYRPKSNVYWEAQNSLAFRNSWMSAIEGGAEVVQIITWNDFSESGQLQPYTDATLNPSIGTGFFDLTAYYAAWFVTGVAPPILRDTLYFFQRKELTASAHPKQPNSMSLAAGAGPVSDYLEVVALLTASGTISLTQSSGVTARPVSVGLTAVKSPLAPGFATLALQRNGSNVFSSLLPVQGYDTAGLPSGVLDLTYWSGSITRKGVTAYEQD